MPCAEADARSHELSTVAERGRSDAPAGRAAAPLDLHKAIGTPGTSGGCERWPEHLKLLNQETGEMVPGRCRATNLCRYCQTLYVVETVEMLTLDAMEYAPTLWGVLTAREHLTRAECRDHLRKLRRKLQKRWPDVEWFVQVEFQRRGALHLNLLFKGVPVEDVDELRQAVVELWCSRVDALPVGQWFGVVEDGVGVVRYLSKMLAHGLKVEQRPPIGWRGHRTSQTRGYLVRPASVMRGEARAALKLKRKLWRGLSLEVAMAEVEHDATVTWSLQRDPVSQGKRVRMTPDLQRARRQDARRPFAQVRPATDSDAALTATSPAEGNDRELAHNDATHDGTCARIEDAGRGGVEWCGAPSNDGDAPPPPPPMDHHPVMGSRGGTPRDAGSQRMHSDPPAAEHSSVLSATSCDARLNAQLTPTSEPGPTLRH